MSRESVRRTLLCAGLAGLALRLLVVAFLYKGFLDPGKNHWEFGYEIGQVAHSIATGDGFASPIWRGASGPTALVAPVFPYLVSAIFRLFGLYTTAAALALLTLNCLLSAVTCVPVFFVAQRSFGLRTGKWAAWVWAFFPYAVYFSAGDMWNHSLMALLLALLFLFAQHLESRDRVSAWMVFGLLSGFSALVRPAILGTVPFLGGWACYRLAREGKHWMKAATVGGLAVFITILPWLARNYLAFRRPVFLQDNFWMEVCVGNLGDARHWWNGGVHPCDSVTEMHEYQHLGEIGYMAEKRQRALAFIEANFGTYVRRSLRRIVFMWTGYWSMNREYLREEPMDPENIVFLTSLTLLSLGGLYKAFRRMPETAMPYFLVLLTFPGVYYLTHPDQGYRHPLDPLLVILASYWLVSKLPPRAASRQRLPTGPGPSSLKEAPSSMDNECGTGFPSLPIHRLAFIMKRFCLLFLAVLVSWASYGEDPLTITARREFDQGKYEAAAASLESGLAKSPREGTWAFWLARCYMELGDLDRALDSAQQAVASDPDNSEYHRWLGRAYGLKADQRRSLGSARKCRQEFERAVRLGGTNIRARRDLLEFYLEAPWFLGGGKAKAWQQALAISEVDPIEGFLARGFYWETLRDTRRAEAEYVQAIELKPASIEPYFEVAEFCQRQENASRMQAVLESAARIETQDARWSYYRAVASIMARNKLPEGEQGLRAYLASPPRLDFPSHASAHQWLGRFYEESGRRQQAMQEYRAALQLNPGQKASIEALKRLEKVK